MIKMAHVAQYKKDVVNEVVNLMKEYPIIGAVNMEDLPAPALQKMREKLRGKAVIKMTKRRLMKVAFEEVEKDKNGLKELVPYLRGMPALLFTKDNPFAIYKTIKQNKSPAPAKAGQIAPKDIEVKAGATPFMPGPIIGELGALGLKTGVENGKVAIKEDKVVVKEGDEIKANAASILTRLGIQPMELGLDITAVYEGGIIYQRKVLDVDEDKFMADLEQSAVWARNLAFEIGYVTKDNIETFIIRSFQNAKALALEANILTDATRDQILAKAESQANSVKTTANIPDAPKEEKKEEPKAEEKPKEETPAEKKEEPKAEEKPAETTEESKEEPKAEEKPKEETPAEEKAEEKPTESVEEKKE